MEQLTAQNRSYGFGKTLITNLDLQRNLYYVTTVQKDHLDPKTVSFRTHYSYHVLIGPENKDHPFLVPRVVL